MPSSNPHLLKLEDFDKYQWMEALENSGAKQCRDYSKEFRSRAKKFQENNDDTGKEIFTFLSSITSTLMNPLSLEEEPILSILCDNQISILRELVLIMTDPEMKARVADILWIYRKRDSERRRPIQMARLAVDSYIESAKNLEDIQNWKPCYQRLKRAANLAPLIDGKKSTDMCCLIVSYIEQLIDRFVNIECEFITGSSMKVIQEELRKSISTIQSDLPSYANRYAGIASKKAESAETSQDYHKAFYQKIAYRQIESEWYKMAGDKESERYAKIKVGEAEVWYGQQALINNESNSFSVAAGRIRNAIAIFKKVEDTFGRRQDSSKRIQELHKQMLAYQQQSISQMVVIPLTEPDDLYDLEMREAAKEIVKEKSLRDALFSLVFDYSLILSVEDLEVESKEQMQSYQLLHLIPTSIVDSEGKTKAVSGDGGNDLQDVMHKNAKFYQLWLGLNFILPACDQICSEHALTSENLSFIFHENPFIPKGRETLYSKGLMAGLKGDLVMASHLLIPQVENSLRHILKQDGSIASKRGKTQDEFLLHEVLNSPDLLRILNADIIFALKGLLVERMGSNLRNEICHGLLDYERFFSSELPYFWWLALYLCLVPTYKRWADEQSER